MRYQAGRRYVFSVHYRRRGGTTGKNTVGVYLYKEGDSMGLASSGNGSLARSLRGEPGMPEEWHALHCASSLVLSLASLPNVPAGQFVQPARPVSFA